MPDISYIARRRRARLVARDDRVYAELRREWQAVRRAVAAEVDAIAARIRTLRARGLTPAQMRAALDREQRLIRLEALVAERVQAFGEAARSIAAAHAEAAATIAPDDARAMIGWGTPPEITLDTVRLPIEAVQELVSVVRSPQWAELFADRMLADGRSLSAALGDELRDGLALGRNPRRIASAMRRVAAGTDGADPLPLSRARTIARTEAMRAYREASRATYAANDALVSGWVWIAGLDRRTCGSCIAQHGSEHPHDEVMATHPNCRCVAAPLVRSWRELGFTGPREPDPVAGGQRWFAALPEREQVAILGRAKARAVRARAITLADLVERRTSPQWGPSSTEASLVAARRNAERRRALARAA